MAQIIQTEILKQYVAPSSVEEAPNRFTRTMFTGNGGLQINPKGGICRIWDYVVGDGINDYDDRLTEGHAVDRTSGFNTDGRDGWGASAFGPAQTIRVTSEAYAMSRHRALFYRLYEEPQYSGEPGYFGDASDTSYEHGGYDNFFALAAQISAIKEKVDKQVIGPDMDHYNIAIAVNGKINGRVVSKKGYRSTIFNGDCDKFDWVAERGPFSGTPMPPKFAPIQCMELDLNNIYPQLHELRNAWNALGFDYTKCKIYIDADLQDKFENILAGTGIPILSETLEMRKNGISAADGFKLNGFQFDFTVQNPY